jgi:hypothetical protein
MEGIDTDVMESQMGIAVIGEAEAEGTRKINDIGEVDVSWFVSCILILAHIKYHSPFTYRKELFLCMDAAIAQNNQTN